MTMKKVCAIGMGRKRTVVRGTSTMRTSSNCFVLRISTHTTLSSSRCLLRGGGAWIPSFFACTSFLCLSLSDYILQHQAASVALRVHYNSANWLIYSPVFLSI
ncbi:hypothetical protein ARMSODRAFT_352494 [Armillaria solidipes]|uniref:Uncharacterized protein n=1 Tax=Armillaria solidipes TaxID=1076256 RepID=A0A2H3BUC0_9AGAR|nr:hypothetical protein ARMSODRAFT_352494 [Armillaria solidipes]